MTLELIRVICKGCGYIHGVKIPPISSKAISNIHILCYDCGTESDYKYIPELTLAEVAQ